MKRNYFRALAITLIFLPEPFTTPFGIILLLVSFMLPKRHKDSLSNLENLVRRYRKYTETTGFGRVARLSKPTVFHHLNCDIPSPQVNITGDTFGTPSSYRKISSNVNRDSDANPHVTAWHDYIDKKTRAEFQYHYSTDSRKVSDKIILHLLRTSVPQYEAVPTKPAKVLHHTLKTTLQPSRRDVFYSRLRPIRSVTQTKVVHHSLKRV